MFNSFSGKSEHSPWTLHPNQATGAVSRSNVKYETIAIKFPNLLHQKGLIGLLLSVDPQPTHGFLRVSL